MDEAKGFIFCFKHKSLVHKTHCLLPPADTLGAHFLVGEDEDDVRKHQLVLPHCLELRIITQLST
jgi:hypothetical protein